MNMEKHSFLAQRSVMPSTREVYLGHVELFREFLKDRSLRLEDMTEDDVDRELNQYIGKLYFEGHNVAYARYAVCSVAWLLCIPTRSAATFAQTKQALKGFQLLDPDRSRDPAPWEACLLISHYLGTKYGHDGLRGACASLLACDAYLRPGETLAVQRRHVVPPKSRRYPHWAIIICPSTEAKMSTNIEQDDTILIGVDVTERNFVCGILEALVERCASDDAPLLPITMAVYAKLVRDATSALGLTALKISPHTWRHGGASVDALSGERSIAAIQRRGRWKAPNSVARYEKAHLGRRDAPQDGAREYRRESRDKVFLVSRCAGGFRLGAQIGA